MISIEDYKNTMIKFGENLTSELVEEIFKEINTCECN